MRFLAELGELEGTVVDEAVYRHVGPRYDPLSGEGARLHGGRYNPPRSFRALYLCTSRACAVAELTRLGARNVVGVEGLLPRRCVEVRAKVRPVLDLTRHTVQEAVGVDEAELVSRDWAVCQQIGTALHASGWKGARVPSAAGPYEVLVVFPASFGAHDALRVVKTETWSELRDLTDPAQAADAAGEAGG